MKPKILMGSSLSWIEDGDFPEWLLLELLIRLPVKSVFRLKLVSKQWLSLISKPYFVRAYVSRASLLPQPWTVVSLNMNNKGSQVLEYGMLEDLYLKPSIGVAAVPPIHQPKEGRYLVFGVSNGLVLYGLDTGPGITKRSYYICNPLTGHCVSLPQLSCKFTFWGWGFLTCVENHALKSYRVVLVEPPIGGSNGIRFRVCVSNIGEWKDFTVPCNLFPLVIKKAATDLNGVLHWIAEGHCIIAYDPYKKPEQMRVIAFPGDTIEVSKRQTSFQSLCVAYKGKLRYFESSHREISGNVFLSFRVWLLNDYSSGDWCLQYNVSHEEIQLDANFPSPRFVMRPICFHPFDSEIVYLVCRDVPASYNIKTRKLRVEDEFFRHAGIRCKNTLSYYWTHSHLFVIPHWPISIPMELEG